MQNLPIKDLLPDRVDVYGALDFDERGCGISPRRLPSWTRAQTPQMMDVMVRMPSGVRLRFTTNSNRVGIEFLATNMTTPPNERRPVVFNLETNGEVHCSSSSAGNCIVLNPQQP